MIPCWICLVCVCVFVCVCVCVCVCVQGFKREWAPFVLTPDFVYVMGGEVSVWMTVDCVHVPPHLEATPTKAGATPIVHSLIITNYLGAGELNV